MRKKVLVADDSVFNRERLTALLEDHYDVSVVNDGQSCLEALAASTYDILLLDIKMPAVGGIEVLAHLVDHETHNLPVIVVSESKNIDDICNAFELGAVDYIYSQFTQDELLVRIETQLALAQHSLNMERQLQLATDSLEEKNEQLDEANHLLLQSEKLASLGLLAAGVAHEINNPVGYVSSNLDSLKEYITDLLKLLDAYGTLESKLGENDLLKPIRQLKHELDIEYLLDDLQQLISESITGVSTIKTIVADLKAFSRKDEKQKETVDIHQCIESALNIARNELKYHVAVEKDYSTLPLVHCNPNQLSQVFLNLLVNSAQAITDKGHIFIQTKMAGQDSIELRIRDNGCGIEAANLETIFKPFYTTKTEDKGTGLGLALSQQIIQEHGGNISVKSVVNQGTEFIISLPLMTDNG